MGQYRIYSKLTSILLISLCIIASSLDAIAKDFGKRAKLFEIAEENLLKMIERKLTNIDMEAEKEKMLNQAKNRVNNPKPLFGIGETREQREYHIDPSVTLKKDILLPSGDILHKAGTKINPLDHMEFDRRLLFVDARKNNQVDWLEKKLTQSRKNQASDKSHLEDRVILVGGNLLELEKRLGVPIYFDQNGELIKKFKIRNVPALVDAHKGQMRVIEMVAE